MAPKAKKQPKAAAKKIATPKADPTLIQSAEAATTRRRLARRATEEQVERALKEHFGDFTSFQVDILQHKGQTLRQNLTADVHQKNLGGKSARLGSSYWAGLRDDYKVLGAELATDPFKLDDEALQMPLNPMLIEGLTTAKTSNTTIRSKAPLQNFLEQVEDLNLRELVGISRHMVDSEPLCFLESVSGHFSGKICF